MDKKIGVLIFPAGEINSVELHDSLATCVNVRVYGASSIDKHGSYIFKNYISGLPMIQEENFLNELNNIIEENSIDVIFPTHDTVAKFFSNNLERIKAKVVVADKKTSEICRDKAKIYELFKADFFCPLLYKEIKEFPLFIKPKEGQGAIGTKLIQDYIDVPLNIKLEDYVICEYLPGEEFTVDCFTDRNGNLRIVLPRSRKRLLAGITVSSENIKLDDEFNKIASTINTKLSFRGLWWFQVKRDSRGQLKLLEISTRCAGTMCMARALGVNLPLLSVYDIMGWNIDFVVNPYNIVMDRALISRYTIDYNFDKVYIDFDDTIIIDNMVYVPILCFLYQCRNKGIEIILITKHLTDIYDDIKKYCIAIDLFDEINVIEPSAEKADFINPYKSIFVDNAFAERKSVYDKLGIPVFDVDTVEVLRDWRV